MVQKIRRPTIGWFAGKKMTLDIEPVVDQKNLKPSLTVMGIGGAGSNAVNNMIQSNLNNVDFIVEIKFFGPICLKIISLLINTDIIPEASIPSRMYGAMSTQRDHISLAKIFK